MCMHFQAEHAPGVGTLSLIVRKEFLSTLLKKAIHRHDWSLFTLISPLYILICTIYYSKVAHPFAFPSEGLWKSLWNRNSMTAVIHLGRYLDFHPETSNAFYGNNDYSRTYPTKFTLSFTPLVFSLIGRRQQKAARGSYSAIPGSQLGSRETRRAVRWQTTIAIHPSSQILTSLFPPLLHTLPLSRGQQVLSDGLNCSAKWKSDKLFSTLGEFQIF